MVRVRRFVYFVAPSKPRVLSCASSFAGRTSIAGGLNKLGIGNHGGVGGFITDALGGNAVSSVIDLARSFGPSREAGGHNLFYNMGQSVLAGPRQGVPGGSGPWGVSVTGMASDAIAAGIHSVVANGGELTTLAGRASTVGLTGAEFASGVGEIKLGYDALTYVAGAVGCKLGV